MENKFDRIEIEWKSFGGDKVCIAKAIAQNGELIATMHFRVRSNVTNNLREFYERFAKLPEEMVEEFVREELKFKLENPGLFK